MKNIKQNKILATVALAIFVFGCSNDSSNGNQEVQQSDATSEVVTENLQKTEVNKVVAEAVEEVQEAGEASTEEAIEEEIEEIIEKEAVIETAIEKKKEAVKDGVKALEVKQTKEEVKELIKEELEEVPKIDFHKHEVFDQLLRKYVSASGKVNYKGLKSESTRLQSYLSELEGTTVDPSWTRNQKLAYWINLYNAATLNLIIKNYPLESITKLDKAWDTKVTRSGERKLTLNEIENTIIRPTFKEPLIHFAVNCAAKSCPKLLNQAFVADRLNTQMKTSAIYFVNNTAKNTIASDRIEISKIFEWYGVDFGGKEGLVDFLNLYSKTKIDNTAAISYAEYDWDLNE